MDTDREITLVRIYANDRAQVNYQVMLDNIPDPLMGRLMLAMEAVKNHMISITYVEEPLDDDDIQDIQDFFNDEEQ